MAGTMALCLMGWFVDPDHRPLSGQYPNQVYIIACKVFWKLDKMLGCTCNHKTIIPSNEEGNYFYPPTETEYRSLVGVSPLLHFFISTCKNAMVDKSLLSIPFNLRSLKFVFPKIYKRKRDNQHHYLVSIACFLKWRHQYQTGSWDGTDER